MSAWSTADIPDLRGRTYVVTGGNSGIGLETVRALAAKGASVVLTSRDGDRGRDALAGITAGQPDAAVTVAALDLADLDSVRAFAKSLAADTPIVDGLINNAGVMMPPLGQTADGFELQFGTNVLGHFALTGLLLPLLDAAPAARVVTLGSLVHWYGWINFGNLDAERRYGRQTAYGQSKLAALTLMRNLQRRLARAGSTTISVGAHPGITQSELARHHRLLALAMPLVGQSTVDGALPSLMAATAAGIEGGDYVGPRGPFTMRGAPHKAWSSPRTRNETIGDRLWTYAQDRTGVHYL